MDSIKRYLDGEQNCVQLIAEFLLYNDFNATLPIFIEEAVTLDYRLSEEQLIRVDHIKRENIQQLLSAFNLSNHISFFKAWDDLVPSTIKEVFDYKKLTFYLHIHFAILPFRNTQKNKSDFEIEQKIENSNGSKYVPVENPRIVVDKVGTDYMRLDVIEESASPSVEYDTDSLDQSQVVLESENLDKASCDTVTESGMERLKSFLAAEGESYSSQQEFLPFFALPYVVNPDKHDSFTSLFQEKWLKSLQDSFYQFIHKYSCGETVAPKIVKFCEKPNTENKTFVSEGGPPNTSDVIRRYKQARRKFSKLHRDHQNLIGVAAELTTALENSVRGQAVDLRRTLNNCAEIFPELFNSIASTNIATCRLKIPSVEPLMCSKMLCCSELDVYKIKSHLLTASIKSKLLILQAVRWRITRGTSEERDQAISWLSRHDVLSIHSDLIKNMLAPSNATTPHPLQQSLTRLLNAIASLRAGRDYLACSDSLLVQLISSLKQEMNVRIDSITSDMLLATLQKLSLRRQPRLVMIEHAMVEWLVTHLSGECERLYSLEFSTALLLNLCLHIEARERCPDITLKLLTDLLDTGQCQIIPMVAGTLYCLLNHDNLNQAARKMNLESILIVQMEKFITDPNIQRQFQTLLKLLRGDLPRQSVQAVLEEPTEDDLDDPETLEADIDADDPVKAVGDDQCGEMLLENQYKRIFPSHAIICPTKMESYFAILPTTPRSRPVSCENK